MRRPAGRGSEMIASIFIHGGNDCRQQSIQIDLERGARLGLLFGGGEKTELMAFGGGEKVKLSQFCVQPAVTFLKFSILITHSL